MISYLIQLKQGIQTKTRVPKMASQRFSISTTTEKSILFFK